MRGGTRLADFLFRADVTGSGVGATNNQGVWSEGSGSLSLVARTGTQAPGAPGGVNFDAKVRRESFEPIDLFHAHIGGMDAFARGLKIAAKLRVDGVLSKFVRNRYRSYDSGVGQEIEQGKATFASLEKYALEKGNAAANESGRQEMLENIINDYL